MARYSVYVKSNDKLYEIPFKMANGKEKTKYDLEELDIYFARPTENNSDALQLFLNKMIEEGKITENPQKVFIGYTYNKEIRQKELIKNNQFIYEAASYYKQQKLVNKHNPCIPKYDKINEFIKEITNFAINDNQAFRSMFYSNLFPKHVYDVLNDYRNTLKKDDYSDKENDLNELKNQIDYNIRKYNYFRSIYLWKQQYTKKLDKNENNDYSYEISLMDLNYAKQDTNTDFEEETINKVEKDDTKISVADYINHKNEYNINLFDWANTNTKEEVVDEHQNEREIYEKEKEQLQAFLKQYNRVHSIEISNPMINYYFKKGGIEAVMSNCSLDDIEALSDEEKEYIGYNSSGYGQKGR